jgi:hypothetical protein
MVQRPPSEQWDDALCTSSECAVSQFHSYFRIMDTEAVVDVVSNTNQEDVSLAGGMIQDQPKALDDNEQAPEDNLVVTCKYCEQTPCWLEQGLYDRMVELEEIIRDEAIDQKLNNKQIRFQLYREATTFIHGHLGKGRRIELPCCVRGEILDLAPAPDGQYTGFKEQK